MTCEELASEYDVFALGISDGPELDALREHLAANCPVCVPGVSGALSFAASLSSGVKSVSPPARLRRRVVNMVRDTSAGKFVWLPWIVAALSFALMIFAVARPIRDSGPDRALDVLRAGDIRQLSVKQTDPSVEVFASPTRGVLLLASHFKPAPAGKSYELWLIGKDADPAPAGVFTPRSDGSVLHIAKPLSLPLAAVAITVEPEGGSEHPTTKPFLVATP